MPSSMRLKGMSKLRCGEIWLADLNPRQGTERGKTRRVLIVRAQPLLDAEHPSTLIVPLTTNLVDDAAPLRVRVSPIGRLKRRSDLLVDQLRAIDNRRLIDGPLARLSAPLVTLVDRAIRDVLDLHEQGRHRTALNAKYC
jgi:mRNA interferase MazF